MALASQSFGAEQSGTRPIGRRGMMKEGGKHAYLSTPTYEGPGMGWKVGIEVNRRAGTRSGDGLVVGWVSELVF